MICLCRHAPGPFATWWCHRCEFTWHFEKVHTKGTSKNNGLSTGNQVFQHYPPPRSLTYQKWPYSKGASLSKPSFWVFRGVGATTLIQGFQPWTFVMEFLSQGEVGWVSLQGLDDLDRDPVWMDHLVGTLSWLQTHEKHIPHIIRFLEIETHEDFLTLQRVDLYTEHKKKTSSIFTFICSVHHWQLALVVLIWCLWQTALHYQTPKITRQGF